MGGEMSPFDHGVSSAIEKRVARALRAHPPTHVTVDGKTVLRRRGPEEFEWVGSDYFPGDAFKEAMKGS